MSRLWSDLRLELRDRIGEPDDTTNWTTDASGGAWLQSEMRRYFNRGQEQVCRDVKTEGTPERPPLALLVDELDIRLFKGINKYRLPKACIDVLMAFHRPTGDNNWRPMSQASIRTLIDLADVDSTSENLTRYEVYGRTGKLMASGVTTGGDNTSCIDTDRASDATYRFDTGTAVKDDSPTPAALAADDRVYNLTDGSVSDVSSIAAGDLTLDGLTGGMRNVFQLGDRFEVVAKEDTREWLYVYPVPDTYGDTELVSITGTVSSTYAIGNDGDVNQKVGQKFKVTNRAAIRYFDIYAGANEGTPRGNIVLTVETDSSGPSGTLLSVVGKAVISEADWSPSSVNRFQLEYDILPTVNTDYWVTLQTEAQSTFYGSTDDIDNNYTWQYGVGLYANGNAATHNGSTWTEVSANDMLMKVWQAPSAEHLRIQYARMPALLTADANVCELPDYALEAALLWSERQAYMKIQDRDGADRALQKYRIEVVEAKERLRQTKQHPMGHVKQTHWRLPGSRGMGRVNHFDSGRLSRVSDF